MKIKTESVRESDEQIRIFDYAQYNHKLRWLFAIPNGGSRDIREAVRLKRQGVKAGVSDMFLPIPNSMYHGLFIELKVGKTKQVRCKKSLLIMFE